MYLLVVWCACPQMCVHKPVTGGVEQGALQPCQSNCLNVCRALHEWAADVMAQEPSVGVEVSQSSTTPDNRTVAVQVQ